MFFNSEGVAIANWQKFVPSGDDGTDVAATIQNGVFTVIARSEATKQSTFHDDYGLLRFARNDENIVGRRDRPSVFSGW
jgi:hypothetical protein